MSGKRSEAAARAAAAPAAPAAPAGGGARVSNMSNTSSRTAETNATPATTATQATAATRRQQQQQQREQQRRDLLNRSSTSWLHLQDKSVDVLPDNTASLLHRSGPAPRGAGSHIRRLNTDFPLSVHLQDNNVTSKQQQLPVAPPPPPPPQPATRDTPRAAAAAVANVAGNSAGRGSNIRSNVTFSLPTHLEDKLKSKQQQQQAPTLQAMRDTRGTAVNAGDGGDSNIRPNTNSSPSVEGAPSSLQQTMRDTSAVVGDQSSKRRHEGGRDNENLSDKAGDRRVDKRKIPRSEGGHATIRATNVEIGVMNNYYSGNATTFASRLFQAQNGLIEWSMCYGCGGLGHMKNERNFSKGPRVVKCPSLLAGTCDPNAWCDKCVGQGHIAVDCISLKSLEQVIQELDGNVHRLPKDKDFPQRARRYLEVHCPTWIEFLEPGNWGIPAEIASTSSSSAAATTPRDNLVAATTHHATIVASTSRQSNLSPASDTTLVSETRNN